MSGRDRSHGPKRIAIRFNAKIDAVRAELKSDIAQVGAGVVRLESEVKTESCVFNARLDEQRQTINALIPQRLAAVGRTDAAE